MNAAGFKRPGVKCLNCQEAFALFLGIDEMVSVENLTDPFDAKCPLCGHRATYPKSAIGILAALGDQ